MPVDFATLQEQAQGQVSAYHRHLDSVRQRLQAAQQALHTWANRLEALEQKVEQAYSQASNRWRSAMPAGEALDATFAPPPLPKDLILLAADGSQINPDPHGEVYFALINLGLVAMDRRHTPVALVRSQLLLNELYAGQRPLSESLLALLRDLHERQGLAWAAALIRGDEATRQAMEQAFPPLSEDPTGANRAPQADLRAMGHPQAPLLTLTDGPLELWLPGGEEEQRASQEVLGRYIEALGALQRLGALSAGYVDNPRADLVVRMLELTSGEGTPASDAEAAPEVPRPWAGVRDRDLLGKHLPPGHRSALFRIRARSLEAYPDDLAPYFFYLNLSEDPQRPALARVEVPGWVAQDTRRVALIHAALLWQGRIIPGRRYPYLLHRAHETAVVTQEDRRQVTWLLQRALLQEGLPPDKRSEKRQLKDASPRTRFRP